MTLFDAEDNPREILEISDYMQHAHPEVSDYRMARCPGGWSIMVFDTGIYRLSNGTSAGGDDPTNEEVSR